MSLRDKRLKKEWSKIQELVRRSSKISVKVLKETRKSRLPEKIEVTYNIKSIVGIDNSKKPIYDYQHIAQITLPKKYPSVEFPPIPFMISDTWHPNIKSSNPQKGHICVNSKALAGHLGLDDLILRIGEILQYKNYLAEDIEPYPEDLKVAEWVREYAEPNGIVDFKNGIVVDDSDLMDVDEGQGGIVIDPEPKPKPKPQTNNFKKVEPEIIDIVIDVDDDEPIDNDIIDIQIDF